MDKEFKDLTSSERRKIISSYLLVLMDDLGIVMTKEQADHILKRMDFWLSKSTYTQLRLNEIYEEIVTNYKKYLPFCFASIRTANHEISK